VGVAGAAGGAGLLGALGAIAALAAVFVGNRRGQQSIEEQAKGMGFEQRGGSLWNPLDKIPHFVNPQTGEDITYDEMMKRQGRAAGGGGFIERGVERALKGPEAIQRESLNMGGGQTVQQLPGDTSWGDYGTRANNPGNLNYAAWENAAGRFNYTDQKTGGGHSMAVFNTMQEGIAAQYKLLARNQQRYGTTLSGALHGYAENPYVNKLGMDPNAQFDIANADPEVVANMIEAQHRREGRRGSHTATHQEILEGIALARAPAAAPPAPTQVAGNVQVDITHKNAPPDATVTARGSGNVDVAPPRTVQPQLAFDTT
jgi:hypothetical protein